MHVLASSSKFAGFRRGLFHVCDPMVAPQTAQAKAGLWTPMQLAAKMVDGIVTFDDVLTCMQKAMQANKPRGATRLGQARAALALI